MRFFLLGCTAGWWLGVRNGRPRAPTHPPDGVQFDFLSLMSHELKTPINVVSGYLELLEDGVPEPLPETARQQVHQARLAAMRLTDLVNNLLTWTRIQGGREHAHPRQTTAANIVRDACGSVADLAEARGIELETHVPPDLELRTDGERACQALRALIANGIKFTEAGSVVVRAEAHGRHIRFQVRDTGIGIPPEHLQHIFEPYWQVEATVRRTRGGAGIGLTVARQIARLLGGDVTVRSVPGDGSEFTLDLARDLEPAQRPQTGAR